MLTDVVVVLLGTLVACGLLLFAVLELLWPRERGARRPAAAPRARTRPASGLPRAGAGPAPSDGAALPGPRLEPPAPSPPAGAGDEPAADARQWPAAAGAQHDVAAPAAPRSPLDECLALIETGRFVDVAARATAALASPDDVAPSPREQAALWGLLGRARERLGDHEAALTAFERAIDAAPEPERAGYRTQLAALGLAAAGDILTRCRGLPDERRLAMLWDARAWLERAQRERPEDEGIAAARAAVSAGYWSASESVVRGLVRRRELAEARRRLVEALADPGLPGATRELFESLRSEALGSEIGDLTATAIRESPRGRDWEALAALERAEALLGESGAALRPERREEISRGLWLGYAKTGMRRLDAGDYEDAVTALLRALGYAGEDDGRREEPRAGLGEALRRLVEDRAAVIRDVAETGTRESARVQVRRLADLVARVIDAAGRDGALGEVQATVDALEARLDTEP
jgi:tetratricopeptide (TPR) repeat protein